MKNPNKSPDQKQIKLEIEKRLEHAIDAIIRVFKDKTDVLDIEHAGFRVVKSNGLYFVTTLAGDVLYDGISFLPTAKKVASLIERHKSPKMLIESERNFLKHIADMEHYIGMYKKNYQPMLMEDRFNESMIMAKMQLMKLKQNLQ